MQRNILKARADFGDKDHSEYWELHFHSDVFSLTRPSPIPTPNVTPNATPRLSASQTPRISPYFASTPSFNAMPIFDLDPGLPSSRLSFSSHDRSQVEKQMASYATLFRMHVQKNENSPFSQRTMKALTILSITTPAPATHLRVVYADANGQVHISTEVENIPMTGLIPCKCTLDLTETKLSDEEKKLVTIDAAFSANLQQFDTDKNLQLKYAPALFIRAAQMPTDLVKELQEAKASFLAKIHLDEKLEKASDPLFHSLFKALEFFSPVQDAKTEHANQPNLFEDRNELKNELHELQNNWHTFLEDKKRQYKNSIDTLEANLSKLLIIHEKNRASTSQHARTVAAFRNAAIEYAIYKYPLNRSISGDTIEKINQNNPAITEFNNKFAGVATLQIQADHQTKSKPPLKCTLEFDPTLAEKSFAELKQLKDTIVSKCKWHSKAYKFIDKHYNAVFALKESKEELLIIDENSSYQLKPKLLEDFKQAQSELITAFHTDLMNYVFKLYTKWISYLSLVNPLVANMEASFTSRIANLQALGIKIPKQLKTAIKAFIELTKSIDTSKSIEKFKCCQRSLLDPSSIELESVSAKDIENIMTQAKTLKTFNTDIDKLFNETRQDHDKRTAEAKIKESQQHLDEHKHQPESKKIDEAPLTPQLPTTPSFSNTSSNAYHNRSQSEGDITMPSNATFRSLASANSFTDGIPASLLSSLPTSSKRKPINLAVLLGCTKLATLTEYPPNCISILREFIEVFLNIDFWHHQVWGFSFNKVYCCDTAHYDEKISLPQIIYDLLKIIANNPFARELLPDAKSELKETPEVQQKAISLWNEIKDKFNEANQRQQDRYFFTSRRKQPVHELLTEGAKIFNKEDGCSFKKLHTQIMGYNTLKLQNKHLKDTTYTLRKISWKNLIDPPKEANHFKRNP